MMGPKTMKIEKLLSGLFIAGLLVFAGCGKKDQTPPAPEYSGVKVDIPKLQQAFSGASQDLQNDVNDVTSSARYGFYTKSLAALDKLANNPALNEQQKKIVSDVTEQLKQVVTKAGGDRK